MYQVFDPRAQSQWMQKVQHGAGRSYDPATTLRTLLGRNQGRVVHVN